MKVKCLNPECDREQYCRGLCFPDYQYVRRLIQKGKTTWEKLEGAGKTLPATKGRPLTIRKWFEV